MLTAEYTELLETKAWLYGKVRRMSTSLQIVETLNYMCYYIKCKVHVFLHLVDHWTRELIRLSPGNSCERLTYLIHQRITKSSSYNLVFWQEQFLCAGDRCLRAMPRPRAGIQSCDTKMHRELRFAIASINYIIH
jgi:hypothetical protein